MQFTVSLAFSEGWRAMKENYGVLLGGGVVYLVLSAVMGAIPLAPLVLTGPLVAGFTFMGVKAYRGHVKFEDLFCGFQRFGATLAIFWLMILVSAVCAIPAGIAVLAGFVIDQNFEGPGIAVIVLGGIVTIVAYVIFGIRFSLAMPICLDTGLGATDSMRESWNLTRPYVGPLIGLGICLFLIHIVLMVLLYLPVIFLGVPLGMGVAGATYCLIVGPREPADQPGT